MLISISISTVFQVPNDDELSHKYPILAESLRDQLWTSTFFIIFINFIHKSSILKALKMFAKDTNILNVIRVVDKHQNILNVYNLKHKWLKSMIDTCDLD